MSRTPIVTILGHVDHGKTTILDQIRKANVATCEAGGITQKISVFTVDPDCTGKNNLTFIDTPGHEAFDLMRTRGGSVADIVLLIVAVNDGVMPQTKESIEIIKAGTAKPIVVFNKCDLAGTDIEKIKRELSANGMQLESMGGKIPSVEVSGKTGKGIKELLDMINIVIEVEGLPERSPLSEGVRGQAVVLESYKDKFKGFISALVVTKGVAQKGDYALFDQDGKVGCEKIKSFETEDCKQIDELTEGNGAKVIGISTLLKLGTAVAFIDESQKKNSDKLYKCAVEEECEDIVEDAEEKTDADMFVQFFNQSQPKDEGKKKLNVIIKASTEGSLEAISKSLEKIESEDVVLNINLQEVGDITQKDIDHAEITKSIILGFEVKIESGVKDLADKKKVIIRTYGIIYELVNEVTDTIEMLESGGEVEEELGTAEVKAIFILSNGSKVVGCRVREGIIKRGERCYITRGDDILAKGKIISMRHQKDEVNEAKVNDDCGLTIEPKLEVEVKEGDMVHCFRVV